MQEREADRPRRIWAACLQIRGQNTRRISNSVSKTDRSKARGKDTPWCSSRSRCISSHRRTRGRTRFYAWPPSDTHERIRAARNDCTTGRRGTRTHLHGRVRVNRPCTIRPRNRSHAGTLAPKEGLDSRRTPSHRCGNPYSAYCRNRTREPKRLPFLCHRAIVCVKYAKANAKRNNASEHPKAPRARRHRALITADRDYSNAATPVTSFSLATKPVVSPGSFAAGQALISKLGTVSEGSARGAMPATASG